MLAPARALGSPRASALSTSKASTTSKASSKASKLSTNAGTCSRVGVTEGIRTESHSLYDRIAEPSLWADAPVCRPLACIACCTCVAPCTFATESPEAALLLLRGA
jgi:hypothetical protein